MYCSNCGTQNENGSIVCRSCGSAIAVGYEYAGYWRRYGAYLLDFFILYIFFLIATVAVSVFAAIGTASRSGNNSAAGLIVCLLFPVYFVLVLLYFAIFESSPAQGSPGKMAVGMKVIDMGGNRISFGKAIVRQIGKVISIIILGIGFIMCGFTEKRQGLHDIMAGTLVVMRKPVYFIEPGAGQGPKQVNNSLPTT